MDAAKKNNWKMTKSLDAQDKLAVQGGSPEHQVPAYNYDLFIQYIVHFIVTDDQVSAALPDFHLAYTFQPSHFVLSIAPNFVISAGFSDPTLNTYPIATPYVNELPLNGRRLSQSCVLNSL